MKLSFSTLGCPDWSWDDIFSTAKDLGMAGIEIRGIEKEIYAPKIKVFSSENIQQVKQKLASRNLQIPMLTSGNVIGKEEGISQQMEELKEYIDLAQKLQAPYVRVLIADQAQPCEADLAVAKDAYKELCGYGKSRGVMPLIETNGPFCDTKKAADFVADVENAGVLWDIHHPFRFCGESPETSMKNLGSAVRYVHIKDSLMVNGRVIYRMLGYGDLPIFDMVSLLHHSGYSGYYSLEWVKRWEPELQEPGVVFSHFSMFMTMLQSEL